MWTTRIQAPGIGHDECVLQRRIATNTIWSDIAEAQAGLISRGQLLGLGLTHAQARTNVLNGRWRRILPGVYATFTGPVDPVQQVWAALLFAGSGAAACCASALWLHRVLDEPPEITHVSIPHSRRVASPPSVRIHRRRALDRPRQTTQVSPRISRTWNFTCSRADGPAAARTRPGPTEVGPGLGRQWTATYR